MKIQFVHKVAFAILTVMVLASCQQPGGNSPGSEFMPDMAHSIAYEANTYTYYSFNTWGTEKEYYHYAKPRTSVPGTVARGSAGAALDPNNADKINKSLTGELTNSGIAVPENGNVPYAYADTEEDRLKASQEIIQAPFPITEAGLKHGKEMYNIYCGICHGEKGDGQGYLVREDGGKYPAQPANLILDQYVDMTNGAYYHAIVYGKNMMGGYADKLSYKERWEVIHYMRALQAKSKKLEYSAEKNTLNGWAQPYSEVAKLEPTEEVLDAADKQDSHTHEVPTGHHGDSNIDHGNGH